MKKTELKNIIKECVKELIFEEKILSNIITEVATGLNFSGNTLQETKTPPTRTPIPKQITKTREKVLSSIGQNGYDDLKKTFPDPSLFEGTRPIPAEGDNKGALGGVAAGDAGVSLESIPGFGNWGSVTKALGDKK